MRTRGKLFITPAALRTWFGRSPHIPLDSHPSKTWGGVSVGVAAVLLGKTPREVRHLIDKGALAANKIDGRLRVKMSDIDIR